jgi:Fe-S-cluster containining protein
MEFTCNRALELCGYCCKHFEVRVVSVLKKAGTAERKQYLNAKALLDAARARVAAGKANERLREAEQIESAALRANDQNPDKLFERLMVEEEGEIFAVHDCDDTEEASSEEQVSSDASPGRCK